MAGLVSEKELENVLMHAMIAVKKLRQKYERLKESAVRLRNLSPADEDVAIVHELLNEISIVDWGIGENVRFINNSLGLAAQNGGVLAPNRFLKMRLDFCREFGVRRGEDDLYHQLVTTEAFCSLDAAYYAFMLLREHHLKQCRDHLRRCIHHLDGEPGDDSSEPGDATVAAVTNQPEKTDLEVPAPAAAADATVAAVTNQLAKTGLSDPATAAADETGELPEPVAESSVELDKARHYLHQACRIAKIAVDHIDIACYLLSGFLDSKTVTNLCMILEVRLLNPDEYCLSDD